MNTEKYFTLKRTNLSQYVDTKYIQILQEEYDASLKVHTEDIIQNEAEHLIHFLFINIQNNLNKASDLSLILKDLKKQLSYASGKGEKENIILEYAQKLTLSKSSLNEDKEAFKRWFDEDALAERFKSKISHLHRLISVALDRVSAIVEIMSDEEQLSASLWDSIDFNREFLQLLEHRQEPMLYNKIFSALTSILRQFNSHHQGSLLDERLNKFIYKAALCETEDVWVQNDAIELLAYTSLDSFVSIAKKRASLYLDDDTIFVRHKIAQLALQYAHKDQELLTLVKDVSMNDTSPYVRQAIAKSISSCLVETDDLIEKILLYDSEPSVRALSVMQILNDGIQPSQYEEYKALILRSLIQEKDSFVTKSVLLCLYKLGEKQAILHSIDTVFISQCLSQIEDLIQTHKDVSLRRYASLVREFLLMCKDKKSYYMYRQLHSFVHTIKPTEGKILPFELEEYPKEKLYRLLSIVSQNDFSLQLRQTLTKRSKLYRGDRFARRFWRILHEFSNPSPDKRQAFKHTIARIYEGTLHFPSSIMAEQAPTKVPGEPYYIPEEESWRPYLPLADHFLSCVKQPTLRFFPFKIYSSEGLTTIIPPKSFIGRFKAKWLLSLRYEKLARLRNWKAGFSAEPSTYIKKMSELGFAVKYEPYTKEDESSTRFFPISIPFISPDLQESVGSYFISAYENSLSDLFFFLLLIFGFFFIRHIILSHKIKKARKKIPLSIGGWGTRGKSGTERIKAALFYSLGLRVFSKTTGCEAMFLHSESFDTMREMYLFRPYDKATIWEQANVLRLADELNADVFLWECMGLTPSYVEVLQQRWMKDDIATLVNAYPDHEDLQGPAGINIPEVMTRFIPKNSTLITSEELMYPIFKAHADSVSTQMHTTSWLEAGLIAPDILKRFPYEEHPKNIALVLRMAAELDIDEDKALKAMADHVIPDLGVLKMYPISHINNRRLSFINSMSANERFATLGNWERMGLDRVDDELEPERLVTTLINNRADRVSRSNVFASILVKDIVADFHVLIGSNLSGLNNYISDAWKSQLDEISIQADETNSSQEKLMLFAKKFRIVRSIQQLCKRLDIMLRASDIDEEIIKEIIQLCKDDTELSAKLEAYPQIQHFYTRAKREHDEFQALSKLCEQSMDEKRLDKYFQEQLWEWLQRRIITIEDFHASGDKVIKIITENTPMGMHNTIVGMQNIKGTGLDFVYKWVAWNRCFHICKELNSSNIDTVRRAITELANFKEHSLLSLELSQESVIKAKKSVASQNEYYQAELQIIEERLHKAQEVHKQLDTANNDSSSTWVHKVFDFIESFLDAADAVKRRKKADMIYKDLVSQHISHEKAAFELKEITQRQKGGWFTKSMEKSFAKSK